MASLVAGAGLTVALAACGGGTVTGPPPAPIGSVAPLPSPSPTPTPNQHPSTSGDTFAYAGTLTQTFTLYGTPAPAPTNSATPQPTSTPWVSTQSENVSQQVSVSNGAAFGGQSNLTDFTTRETDTGARSTLSVASNSYAAFVPNAKRANGVDVTLTGTSSVDSNGNSWQTVNGTGNGILDEMPEVTNAQWMDSAARTETEKDATGEMSTSTYNANGTYQENFTFPEGGTATVVTNADGSGSYQMPLFGHSNSSVNFNPPANGQITASGTILAALPESVTFSYSDWYPTSPPVFASDLYQDQGAATLPSSCNVSPSINDVSIDKIVEKTQRLDVVFGELETQTTTSYVGSPDGLLCVTTHDDLLAYYDYTGQTPYIFVLGPIPVRHVVTDETLALQSATTAASSAHRSPHVQSLTPAIPRLTAAVLTAHVHAAISEARAARVRAFHQAVLKGKAK